ncbi:MAG: hypothetical protein OXF84_04465 [Bacteroidetes bacterium]|nr:hypothetical protein [Bacteroidota bacterium]
MKIGSKITVIGSDPIGLNELTTTETIPLSNITLSLILPMDDQKVVAMHFKNIIVHEAFTIWFLKQQEALCVTVLFGLLT